MFIAYKRDACENQRFFRLSNRRWKTVFRRHSHLRLIVKQLRNTILIECIYNHINGNNNNHNRQRNIIYYLSCFLMVHLIDIEY